MHTENTTFSWTQKILICDFGLIIKKNSKSRKHGLGGERWGLDPKGQMDSVQTTHLSCPFKTFQNINCGSKPLLKQFLMNGH